MFRFHRTYFFLFLLIFLVEVLIALYLDDPWIRPYGGDFLVVILLYCFLKSFVALPPLQAGLIVLVFAFLVETAQYYHLVNRLGLEQNRIARTVIGVGFDRLDLVAYTTGIAFVFFLEYLVLRRKR